MQEFMTSRSRALEYQVCPRKRMWLHEVGGTGLELIRQAIPLVTGAGVHLGLAGLLRGSSVEEAVGAAVDWYKEACASRGLQLDQLADESRIFNEQKALIEGIVRLGAMRVVPALLQSYEVLEVERMDTAQLWEDIDPLIEGPMGFEPFNKTRGIWRSIPDALLRNRADGDLYLLSWKTCGELSKNQGDDARVDMQGVSEAWAIDKRLESYDQAMGDMSIPLYDKLVPDWWHKGPLYGQRIRGIQMVYLVKGRKIPIAGAQDASGVAQGKSWRTNSPLIYGYQDKSFPPKLSWGRDWRCGAPHPMRKSQWYPSGECPGDGRNHKRGDDWESFSVWESLGVKSWMEMLAGGKITPEAGDPFAGSWAMPVPQFRTMGQSESWLRQITRQERQVAADLEVVRLLEEEQERDALKVELDLRFPQFTQNCRAYNARCPAWEICWGPEHVAEDPLGSGIFQVRTQYRPEVEKEVAGGEVE